MNMKSVRIRGYGQAPTLEEVAMPEVGAGEVLVRVKAASFNPLDVKLQTGVLENYFPLQFPYALGTDLAGTIEKLGLHVQGWHEGDRVFTRLDPTLGGALSEFAVVPTSSLVAAPQDISLDDLAGIPTTAGTAWQALFEVAGLKSGQRILIHAGAGGVGSFAIQVARHAGARVIATASAKGIEIANRLGADQVIDYKAEDFTKLLSDIDLVLDTVGGKTQQQSFDVLRVGGILVSTVSAPDEELARAHGVTAHFVFHKSDASRMRSVVKIFEDGRLKVLIDRKVPLVWFGEGLAHQASGRAHGKIIVTMP